ncbi:hypothetical protein CCHL11_06639 [Colletotrichum chlorophyti]|uniref:Uncharacterized protein n=1 Tax=Colletotrichum chlorophyti TaxID=708187 RepID=A0A1Q8RXP5_9PEZI|nr:hypothetical protein CCHL11_06639 [Colletotrichum chlorophyti]
MFATTQRLVVSALAAASLFLATPTSAAAIINPRQGPGRVHDWITVDSSGHAHTFTPSVVTSNGALATLNPPPYSLTGTVFTVTVTNGGLTTSTGNPPPPQASNTKGMGGVFSVCNNRVGEDGPFCQPRRGSTLRVGTTYYITWDTTFFDDPETPIAIVGFDVDNGVTDTAAAFSLTNISGGAGWVPWTPRLSDLEERSLNNMTIGIMYNNAEGEEKQVFGPVFTLKAPLTMEGTASTQPNLLAIILPVILISLAIASVMLWLYIRRRRRAAAAVAAKHTSAGYGAPEPRVERPVERPVRQKKGSADIQLEPTSPPPDSPTGRNVFQEEVQRQARERT